MECLLALSVLVNVLLVFWLIFASDTGSIQGSLLINQPLKWNGGHPLGEQTGNCFCNAEKYCMCTPSLAIDLVILSGNDHVWLVRRKDTNQLATMGGFVQVGEAAEAAVQRELMEEMGITWNEPPVLLGVYSDPRRDNRRHTVSATYAVRVDADAHPVAADDVKEVHRIPLADIDNHSFFADHKTILTDFRAMLQHKSVPPGDQVGDFANDIVRSLCDLKHLEWVA